MGLTAVEGIDSLAELFGEPISVCTRAQGVEDGVLVDLSSWAGPEGIIGGYPAGLSVVCTAAVWADLNAIPMTGAGSLRDLRGRAHDILWMSLPAFRVTLGQALNNGSASHLFSLRLPIRGTRKTRQVYKVHVGGGDHGEPVVTILRPDES